MIMHRTAILASLFSLVIISSGQDVDGNWNEWMDWTTCSVSCGAGYHVRSRICDNPEPAGNGTNCTGSDVDTKHCYLSHCPVDGEWSDWEAWRGCTTTCGYGVTYRTRKCDNPAPAYNGSYCNGTLQDFNKCFTRNCPIDGGWTNWSEYGECSRTCGYGVYKQRTRNCTNPEPKYGGSNCTGDEDDFELCDYVDCKDGTWEDWAGWSQCSATCGISVHFRFRNCTFSVANNGSCLGNEYESGICSSHCPVDGDWSVWRQWGSCSVTCEKGTRTRLRSCSNPTPAYGGDNCTGADSETENCTDPTPCPIDGGWTNWAAWTDCDATCGDGYHVRIRRCANPPPYYGGKPCPGSDIETEQCSFNPCPQDGGWSNWFPWSKCSITCGDGTRSRIRTCTNPKPAYGGSYCDGDLEETGNCTISPDVTNCTIDGGWSSWGSWGSCGVTCGSGEVTRSRTCTNPAPHGTGKQCVGDPLDKKTCSVATECPVNGGWSTWRDWFPCSVTCGNGTQTRLRTCSNPKPAHGGDFCQGNNDETRDCTESASCKDGGDTAIPVVG